jgi:hypothetical protein
MKQSINVELLLLPVIVERGEPELHHYHNNVHIIIYYYEIRFLLRSTMQLFCLLI